MVAKRYLAFCYQEDCFDCVYTTFEGSFASIEEAMAGTRTAAGSNMDLFDLETEQWLLYTDSTPQLSYHTWKKTEYEDWPERPVNVLQFPGPPLFK